MFHLPPNRKFRKFWLNGKRPLPPVSPPKIPCRWRVTTQIWIVLLIGRAAWEIWFNQSEAPPRSGYWTRHQYGISALVSQTSFDGETSGSVAKCRLFSRATGGEALKWCIIGGSEEKKLISEISTSARCSHSQQYYNQCLNTDLLYRRVV